MKRYVFCFLLIVLLIGIVGCTNSKTVNYKLVISIDGRGDTVPAPGTHKYNKNAIINLEVTPAEGYQFSNWDGPDGDKVNQENEILMNKDMEIIAIFEARDIVEDPQYSVSGGTYNGARQVEISCATSGAEIRYTTNGDEPTSTHGTVYSGSLTIAADTTLKAIAYKSGMTDSSVVTADYVINYSLTTEVSPSGGGSVSIDTDKSSYKYGEDVELTAIANSGYNFSNWSGDLNGNNNPATLTIDDNKSVTAEFIPRDVVADPQYSVNGGTYNGARQVEISCVTSGAEIRYTTNGDEPTSTHGTVYSSFLTIAADTTLKAIAYKSGMTDSSVVTADYVINYSLTTEVSPSGAGSVSIDTDKSSYKYGEDVELTAIANSGYNFSNWSGDLNGSNNPATLTIDDNKSVTAEYSAATYNVSFMVKDEAENPIDGATVTINSNSKTTDASGEAIFALDGGNYSYTVSYGDFNDNNSSITVDQNKSENVVMLYYASTESELNSALGDNNVAIINLESSEYDLSANTCTVNGAKTLKSASVSTVYLNIDQNYSNITAQDHVSMKHLVDGNLTTNINRILGLETIINGDLIITGGTLDVNSQNVSVSGSILHRGGTLNVNKGVLNVDSDFIIEKENGSGANAILQMTDIADYITVGGNFLMESNWSHSDKLTAGTLEIKGDFTRQYNSQSAATYYNFDTSDTHRVILSGSGNQTVDFAGSSSATSCFANLELNNTGTLDFDTKSAVTGNIINKMSTAPINITNLYPAGTATINDGLSNEGEWPWDIGIYENWTLDQDIDIDGDYYLLGNCTVNPEGYTMNIGGNFYQRKGTFNVNGSTINITGNYIIQEENGNGANAILQMTNIVDYITIGGNFLMDSNWSHTDKLTSGTLEVKGDFTRQYNSHSAATYSNFDTSDTHRVILSGSGNQTVDFAGSSSTTSCFANLELNNIGTLEFTSKSAVTGNIINKMSTAPTNITNLYPADTATINSGLSNEGEWPWDMGIHENWTLAHNVDIDGNYYLLGNCTVNPDGFTMNIGGNFYQRKGTLDVNGGVVNITGDYIIEEEDESCATAYLQMTDADDHITVGGNFIMHSQYSSNTLSAGILEVKGDFTQKHKSHSTSANENFNATGNHKVILSGSSQSVSFAKPHSSQSCFANLELNNTGTLEFASKATVTCNIINNMSTVPTNITNLYPAGTATINFGLSNQGEWSWDMGIHEDWTLQHDMTVDGDLHIYSGALTENGHTLTVNGSTFNH